MLVIVMLLSCSISLAQNNARIIPSTGEELLSDTAVAVIPVYLLKQANAKMIERKYLLKIVSQQDTIINNKDSIISIINNDKNKFLNAYQIEVNKNKDITKELNREISINKVHNTILTVLAFIFCGLFIIK